MSALNNRADNRFVLHGMTETGYREHTFAARHQVLHDAHEVLIARAIGIDLRQETRKAVLVGDVP